MLAVVVVPIMVEFAAVAAAMGPAFPPLVPRTIPNVLVELDQLQLRLRLLKLFSQSVVLGPKLQSNLKLYLVPGQQPQLVVNL